MRSSPIQVGSGFYRTLTLGNNSTMAIDPYGTLTAWGENLYGQAGINSINNTLSWIQLNNGDAHSFAIRSDSTLWAWGLNSSGQLGTNDTINRTSPTQVTGSWSQIRAGFSHTVGIRTNNSVWLWGNNANGQLGQGESISRSSPVQLPVTSTGYSIAFPGNGNYVSGSNAIFNVSALVTTWTVEMWVYPISTGYLFAIGAGSAFSNSIQIDWGLTTANKFTLRQGNGSSNVISLTTSGTYPSGTWYYLAVTKDSSGVRRIYVNGVLDTSVTNTTSTFSAGTTFVINGAFDNNGLGNNGGSVYISNLRVLVGTASYTGSTHTVPTSTSTDITNTKLLTARTTSIVDNSSLGLTLTTVGSTAISFKNPFDTGFESYTQISAGNNFTLAIRNSDKSLWSWGLNSSYQLSQGNTINRSSPVQIGTSSWLQVSAGNAHVLGIDTNYKLYTWGLNTSGQAGINTRPGWSMFTGSMAVQSTNAGIRTDGSLWAWGANTGGILGTGDTIFRSSPVQIGTGYRFVDIGNASFASIFAIKSDGSAIASGSNTGGYLGIGNTIDRSSPVQVSGGISWNIISGGFNSVAGIDTSGRLYTWGGGGSGQLGDGFTTNNRSAPTQIAADKTWSTVAMSGNFALAITTQGALWAWGLPVQGALGDDTVVSKSSPVQIGTSSWSSVYVSASHVIAIKADNTLWGWGFNSSGQLGLGDTAPRSSPVQIGVGYSWTSVSLDDAHSLFKRSDNTIWATGSNAQGRLGDGSGVGHRSNPVQILAADENWNIFPKTALATSQAIRVSDGSLWVAGADSNGVLGLNTTVASYTSFVPQTNGPEPMLYSPMLIGTSSWSTVSAGYSHSLAITSDNKLFSWGRNTEGQLGIDGTFSFTSIAAGLSKVSVIRNDNSLWVWGNNANGQLGDGTTTTKSSPVIMMTKNYWKTVTRGTLSDYALTVDNKLFAWGENSTGSLGDSTTISKSSPIQVGTSSWSMVATGGLTTAGTQSVYAIRSDGGLFVWGANLYGQLGQNDAIARSSPVQLGTSSWSIVSAGGQFAMAITSDGLLYAWGRSDIGQLGQNDIVSRSSPVQIGTSSWSQISAGASHAVGIKLDNTVFAWGLNAQGQLGDATTISRSSPVQITKPWIPFDASAFNLQSMSSSGIVYPTSVTPFASAGTTGNSVFFDGATGIINLGSATPVNTQDFTMELWFYLTSNLTFVSFGDSRYAGKFITQGPPVGAFDWRVTSADSTTNVPSLLEVGGYFGTKFQVTGLSIPINQWHHTAISRSGSDWAMWFNGTRVGTYSGLTSFGYGGMYLGGGSPGGAGFRDWFPGYLSNVRYVSGSTVYNVTSTTITVPTSPLTAISGTALLTAQYFDPYWVSQISAGGSHSVAIDITNKIFAWGHGGNGALGLNDLTNRSAPTQLGLKQNWTLISAGSEHTIAHDATGTLWTWGLGTTGQLGDNTQATKSSPVIVGSINLTNTSSPIQVGTSSWSNVCTGNNTTAALSPTNKLFVWGLGTTGQLGTGLTFSRSSPVQINSNSYNLVNAGGTHTTYITTISPEIILSTGFNSAGQLGLSYNISRSSPTQVAASSTSFNSPVTVSTGNYANYYINSPTQIGSSSWTAVSAGGTHTLGIKYDNTLWAWGYNANGQLADSTTINKSSPVQVGTSSWSQITAGDLHNVIAKSDGTINTFGLNSFGQLGDGT